jgi:hypothetical protein
MSLVNSSVNKKTLLVVATGKQLKGGSEGGGLLHASKMAGNNFVNISFTII